MAFKFLSNYGSVLRRGRAIISIDTVYSTFTGWTAMLQLVGCNQGTHHILNAICHMFGRRGQICSSVSGNNHDRRGSPSDHLVFDFINLSAPDKIKFRSCITSHAIGLSSRRQEHRYPMPDVVMIIWWLRSLGCQINRVLHTLPKHARHDFTYSQRKMHLYTSYISMKQRVSKSRSFTIHN